MTDRELLQAYVEGSSQEAFAQVVERYINLVYSAARRQLGERNWAEDVVQRVFMTLSKKAASLPEDVVLAGWLVNVTRFVCLDEIKSEKRRKLREQKAAAMAELERAGDGADWDRIEPQLDEALETLSESNRLAVALRYLQGLSISEVARELSISEDAAKQRMSRGVEQLRDFFSSRGVVMPTAGLTALLSAHALEAAPAGLAGAVAAGVGSGAAIAKGMVITMAATKAKTGVLATVLVLLFGAAAGSVALVLSMEDGSGSRAKVSAPIAIAPAGQAVRAGQRIEGLVKAPNGDPIANAEVFLAHMGAQVSAYANVHVGRNPGTRTTPDGRFELPMPSAPPDTMILMIRSDAGYLEITPGELKAAGGVAAVQPWARVEGIVYAGATPIPLARVTYMRWGSTYDRASWQINHSFVTQADTNGRFVFPRVAPGDFWVVHLIPTRLEGRQSHHTHVHALPGQTTLVHVGGTGRPIVGRVVVEADQTMPLFHGSLYPDKPSALKPPLGWDLMSMDEKRAYEREWRRTDEGQRWMREECRNYEFAVQPDGTFRVTGVLPGTYSLSLRAQVRDLVTGKSENVASLNRRIVVPPMDAPRVDEPLDLGTLEARPKASSVR